MMPTIGSWVATVSRRGSFIGALVVFALPVGAQEGSRTRAVALTAGMSSYDVRGTGRAWTTAIRVERPIVGTWLLSEVGVGYSPIKEQGSAAPTQLGLLDVQVHAQTRRGRVRPYIGTGVGAVTYLSGAGSRKRLVESVSGAVGFRIDVGLRTSLRVDARLRYWDYSNGAPNSFVNGNSEITVGLARRF